MTSRVTNMDNFGQECLMDRASNREFVFPRLMNGEITI